MLKSSLNLLCAEPYQHFYPDDLSSKLDPGVKFDVATLIFVLSAIDPCRMPKAVENVYDVMTAGGKVCVRDYAVNDHAMLRFGVRGHKLAERFVMFMAVTAFGQQFICHF